MRTLNTTCLVLLLAVSGAAVAGEQRPSTPTLANQLAIEPVALVQGNQCKVYGAVWAANRARSGVNINLELPDGSIVKSRTNDAGIYTASVPFAGSTLVIREHIADPVSVPTALKDKARIYSPLIECSHARTAAFLRSTNPTATGGAF